MTAQLIHSIRVEKLFGLYTYDVPSTGELSNAAILYGDNGVGKSTLLRLVFHLLSAANNRGHRTALYTTEFRSLEVLLVSGIKLVARSTESQQKKVLVLEITKDSSPIAIWEYRPERDEQAGEMDAMYRQLLEHGNVTMERLAFAQRKSADSVPRGELAYMEALKNNVPTMFMLNADRKLDSDSVADPADEVELRRMMQYGEPRRINELVARSREIALSQALSAAARWIGRKAVLGANQGSMNVHSVYGDVLRRLMSPSSKIGGGVAQSTIGDLQKQLAHIDSQTEEHARYELATHLPTTDFRKSLSGRSTKKTKLAADLLKPYVKSLEGRLTAVEPIYQLIDRFVKIVNRLLSDKTVTFKLSQGFSIQNKLGVVLTPAQLSSGEQQLLLLFCYVLVARDSSSVFMIDEPEISLNVKWQRQLIQSLLDLTLGASIQFVFASHSIELLAQHRNRVVKLVGRP